MDLIERIEHLFDRTMSAVKAAAERCDVHALQQLARSSQQLKSLKDRAMELDQELRCLENATSDESTSDGGLPQEIGSQPKSDDVSLGREATGVAQNSNAHRMVIEVTQGMINQNLLSLTEHVKAGRIRPGLEMKIEARPSGELFCTDLLSAGNRLRERGAIARFYRDNRVNTGDRVVLVEKTPDRWILEKLQEAPSLPPQSNKDIAFKI